MHGSTQCLVSSHETTSKQNTCTTNCYCLWFLTTKQLNILVTNTATIPYVSIAPSWALTLTARSSARKEKWIIISAWDQDHYILVALMTSCISELKAKWSLIQWVLLEKSKKNMARKRKRPLHCPVSFFIGKQKAFIMATNQLPAVMCLINRPGCFS